MAPETESERFDRIRQEQIKSRGGGSSSRKSKTYSSTGKTSQTSSKKKIDIPKPKIKLPLVRANTTANAMHDIAVGFGIAAIPAILIFIVLPGGFKLLGFLILLGGAGAGYLLGETNP